MKKIQVPADVFGQEFAGKNMPGYDLQPSDPRLPPKIGGYVFQRSLLAPLSFAWNREHIRPEERARMGVLLIGPKGSGKTTLPEQFFTRLGVPVFGYTANRSTEISDLLESRTLIDGSICPVEGPLLTAMRTGCPFVLNEIDLMDPAALTGLNDVIERGIAHTSTGIVKAARGFIVIATCNGVGDDTGNYAGTNRMNDALVSRFGIRVVVAYPEAAIEEKILVAITGASAVVAKRMVEAANLIRGGAAVDTTISTRELLAWAEVMMAFGAANASDTPRLSAELTLANGADPASREAIIQTVQRVFGATAP